MKRAALIVLALILVLTISAPPVSAAEDLPAPRLSGLSAAGSSLCLSSDPDETPYKVFCPLGTKTARVEATAQDGLSVSIEANGMKIDGISTNISLKKVKTPVQITVSNGVESFEYSLDIILENIKNVRLSTLTTNRGISPRFSPAVNAYQLSVPYNIASIVLGIKLAKRASKYVISVNDAVQGTKRAVVLQYGNNSVKVEITSPAGQKAAYTIEIYRENPNDPTTMSPLEEKFVETFMRLMPERHPFVLAYEEAHGVDIDNYVKEVNGVRVSGVAFSTIGTGHVTGFDPRWWQESRVYKYPVWGLDCSEFVHWIYHNVGYEIPRSSSKIFFKGTAGVKRYTPRIKKNHWVIPTLAEAKIGDVVYSSKDMKYRAGWGSHCMMFLGTARELGIAETLKKYIPDFPMDAYLVADCGWSDVDYYAKQYEQLNVCGRRTTYGVGIQFFTSIMDNDGTYIYRSPYLDPATRAFSWTDELTGYTFVVDATMESQGKTFQHKPGKDKVQYLLNIARPIIRND